MSPEVIVVGSGPAAVAAALELQDRELLMLDVGHEPARVGAELTRDLHELRKSGRAPARDLIGDRFESLHNIDREYLSPKLKPPLMRYVTDGWRELCPVEAHDFDPMISLARGGLANAWGAGVYRFGSDELRAFPFGPADLAPHYDRLSEHIGISGRPDDLERFFGGAEGLLPPVELNRLGADLLARYEGRRGHFRRRGLFVGHPRIALLTRDLGTRTRYAYDGLEFFKPRVPAIYNPAFTLDELKRRDGLTYVPRRLVVSFEEDERGAVVRTRHTDSGEVETFRAPRLILAAGALNTARIVLHSRSDHETRLPLLDNPISYVPLVSWRHIGAAVDSRSLPLQLNLIYEGEMSDRTVQGSIYGMTAPLWTDFLFDLPFAARSNIVALRHLLPAMMIVQLFYPDTPSAGRYLRLRPDERLELHYEPHSLGRLEHHLIRVFRRIGYFGFAAGCRYPRAGNSFHYAGGLPMTSEPGRPYTTDPQGLLQGTRGVYVADAACFPDLPSRNLTYTIMAVAMRVAGAVRRSLGAP